MPRSLTPELRQRFWSALALGVVGLAVVIAAIPLETGHRTVSLVMQVTGTVVLFAGAIAMMRVSASHRRKGPPRS